MRARIESLDLLANNIANSSTTGFKADREFYGLYVSADARAAVEETGRPRAVDSPEIEHHWTDWSQGSLVATGKPLDLALSGAGFFIVSGPDGARWTRNGNFRLSKSGVIETQQGDPVLVKPPVGRGFTLDPDLPVSIQTNGEIVQANEVKGTIQLASAVTSGGVAKLGNSYFKIDSGGVPAETPGLAPAEIQLPAGIQPTAEIQQGYLESSNVAPADSAVRLVSVMRQFEMLQKATTLAMDMNRKAIDEVGRVGS